MAMESFVTNRSGHSTDRLRDVARQRALARLKTRRRTVWDARRLLRPQFGRMHRFVFEDGQHAVVVRYGILIDVVHSPRYGFVLKVKGLMAEHDPAARSEPRRAWMRRSMSEIPVDLLRDPLPETMAFLTKPPEEWPFPPPTLSCARCSAEVVGRFCSDCGLVMRKGAHLGELFSAEQQVLRYEFLPRGLAVEHDCGAVVAPWWHHCAKCGVRVARRESSA